jgi:multidrug efflux pump subunit AcrA (membrane-fusion protein)
MQDGQPANVKRVLVKGGERVKAGQPLAELDPALATANKATVGNRRRRFSARS